MGRCREQYSRPFPAQYLCVYLIPCMASGPTPFQYFALSPSSAAESFRCCSSTEGSLGSAGLGSPEPAHPLCWQCWGDAVLPCTVLLSYFPVFVCGSRGGVVLGPPCRGLSPSYSSGRCLWSDTCWHALLLTGTARHKLTAPCKPLV